MRVNPDVDAATHPYISTGLREHKFGIDIGEAEAVYARAAAHEESAARGRELPHRIADAGYRAADGGGRAHAGAGRARLRAAGIPIRTPRPRRGLRHSLIKPGEFTPGHRRVHRDASPPVRPARTSHLMVEPGRSIVGEAGVLLARVLYRKTNGAKEFIIVDAAMNDLIRPALYQSHHEILPVREARRSAPSLPTLLARCARAAISWRAIANCRTCSPATCWPSARPALMASSQSSNYNARPRRGRGPGGGRFVAHRPYQRDLGRSRARRDSRLTLRLFIPSGQSKGCFSAQGLFSDGQLLC